MRRMNCLLAAALLAVSLTGCQKTAVPSVPAPEETAQTEAPEPFTGGSLPVISIVSENQGADCMNFVTEPVAEHVSQLVALWTPDYVMPPAPWYEACTVTMKDADGSVLLDGADADVKVRGNWSTVYEKKPLRLKFKEKQSALGLHDGAEMKNWVLLAECKDYSMLRNWAALSVSRAVLGADGLYAADAALAEVEVNGQYWGVYLLTEQQQIHPQRVAVTEAEKDYTGTDIGYFLEYDGYYTNEEPLQAFAVDYAGNAPLVTFAGDTPGPEMRPLSEGGDQKKDVGITIKSDIHSQAQHDFIAAYVNNVYRILYAAAYEDTAYAFNADYTDIAPEPSMTPQQAAAAAVNLDSLADMYLISELTCDADLYWSSFFMAADFGEGGDRRLTFEAPWDFDSALGNKDRCADGKGFYAASVLTDVNDTYETVNPWLTVLMQEEWFREIVREKWARLRASGVLEQTCADIRALSEAHEDAFARNDDRWKSVRNRTDIRNELCRRSMKCKTQQEAAAYLAEWLEQRTAFMDGYYGG